MTIMTTHSKAVEIPTVEAVRNRLAKVDQSHLLNFVDELAPADRDRLLAQIAEIDVESLPWLVNEYVLTKPVFHLPPHVLPASFFGLDGRFSGEKWDREAFRKVGEALIRGGKVAAFVVAGGQGSRLGYEGPKGCYPAGSVSGRPLFGVFADALLGAQDRYGAEIPWYIMTSPLNHDQTVEFFEANGYFGLKPANVRFFQQGVMPSLDIQNGRVLLSDKATVATNPDGHGGSLRALWHSGSIDDMKRRGIEHISYFQVDNPLVNIVDPVFIGLHAKHAGMAASSGQMSSKMVAKRDAAEKVGVFCMHGAGDKAGRIEVIEYSDLPKELCEQREEDGSLRYCAGSIAVHMICVPFVERLNTQKGFHFPYHRAEKKIPCIDPTTGERVTPTSNNGVKLEAFVFDALPMCEKSILLETDRVEEFAPIKNAEGADSPASCREIQTLRAARWLESLGVSVPKRADGTPDCVLEISPRTATNAQELQRALGAKLPRSIERGASIVL